jgi:environmental stress-induced protein Ves
VILPDAWRWVPWRNGQGHTAELHIDGKPERPEWRLSLAVIDHDAPFSAWVGFDRELVLVRGGPLQLSASSARWTLRNAGDRAQFTGEADVVARIGSRATVLNVMVRRDSSWQLASIAPVVRIAHVLTSTRLRVGNQPLDVASGTTLITRRGTFITGPPGAYILYALGHKPHRRGP